MPAAHNWTFLIKIFLLDVLAGSALPWETVRAVSLLLAFPVKAPQKDPPTDSTSPLIVPATAIPSPGLASSLAAPKSTFQAPPL
eukprot:IDg22055t1